ncbi:TIGR02680 family protein [Haliangium sp.]|uniref:TIGR02680 family protein n=1 Tax=Haliangium sp. TaxID=2663208 RepID=UPI003D0F6B63
MSASNTQPTPQARRLPEPGASRWQLLRAGLHNIWQYDDQRFVFHRGRLLLRGRNESGKTKALEVLLPFLLDADLAPQRLDPFGSTSRPMRWNLINDETPTIQVRISYVWLEFGRLGPDGGEYCTIGAGLRAKRTTPGVDSWYFLTSQRVDRDLHLVNDKALLTRARIEDAIGIAGRVFDRKADYRRAVNRRLFEMPEEQYAALIDTLLQLRRPQLSKALQPSQLSQILTASLPPLDARVIGRLAEGFQRLEQHRAERDRFADTLKTVKDFLTVYRRYVKGQAKSRALAMTRADSAHQRARGALREAQENHEEARRVQDALAQEIVAQVQRDEHWSTRIQTLKSSDAYRAAAELDQAEELARIHAEHALRARARVDEDGERLRAVELQVAQATAEVDAHRARLADARAAARQAAVEAMLDTPHRAIEDLVTAVELSAADGTLASVLTDRGRAIATLDQHAQAVRRAEHEAERARERLQDAAQRERDAADRQQGAQAAEEAANEAFLAAVDAWLGQLEILTLDEHEALFDTPLDQLQLVVGQHADRVRDLLDERGHELETERREQARALEAVRAEHEALAAMTHPPPTAPAWRAPRPVERAGAPLYLLCDFRDQDSRIQAQLEAALEASALLDAWVTPEGQVLDPDTFDLILAAEPLSGPTLVDALVPIEAGGVARHTIERVLRTVALVTDASPPQAGCWVSVDGRFRVGPVHGAWRKDTPAYIGATARERERARRLAELEARISELDASTRALDGELEQVRARRAKLRDEVERFPSLQPVVEARARTNAAEVQLGRARVDSEQAATACRDAERHLHETETARDVAAAELGLRAWVLDLDGLRRVTDEYRESARAVLQRARDLVARQEIHELRAASAEAGRRRVEQAREEAEEAEREARTSKTHAATLREAVGATRDELFASLREGQAQQRSARKALSDARTDKSKQDEQVGAANTAVHAARQDVDTTAQHRTAAEAEFRAFAELGFLSFVEIDESKPPATWSLTDTLLVARQVDGATPTLDDSPEARERAENLVSRKQQELTSGLPSEVRVLSQRRHGVIDYEITLNGRNLGLLALESQLADDVMARDQLLDQQERLLFESFLRGETHEHVRARLRLAHRLIAHMNEQLAGCPTATGRTLRLRWEVSDRAPAGTTEAIELLLRSGELLADPSRDALQRFLQQRLDEARTEDGAGSLEERMLNVLDYRTWHVFTIEFQDPGGGWKRLTKKVHGAGSGGQKAVMLHLPLFAAAAAFYTAACDTAPRLILLDEAFAGIDVKIRAQLMSLLVRFDLDFVMTSYEEWGFYAELDGLSTYHLSREPGLPGVYTEWFLWDGHQVQELGAG